MNKRPRPSFLDAIANLRRDGRHGLRLVTGVLAIWWNRLTERQTCCGDYGAPGC
ncbi:MAG: hypothetical protein OXH13_02995 [Chloroflexi bacterium]|nr:hypothetical protein [Chloroflexota bacterium]MCY3696989.1 hypothetical protein [Chloroflexota bacterium]